MSWWLAPEYAPNGMGWIQLSRCPHQLPLFDMETTMEQLVLSPFFSIPLVGVSVIVHSSYWHDCLSSSLHAGKSTCSLFLALVCLGRPERTGVPGHDRLVPASLYQSWMPGSESGQDVFWTSFWNPSALHLDVDITNQKRSEVELPRPTAAFFTATFSVNNLRPPRLVIPR